MKTRRMTAKDDGTRVKTPALRAQAGNPAEPGINSPQATDQNPVPENLQGKPSIGPGTLPREFIGLNDPGLFRKRKSAKKKDCPLTGQFLHFLLFFFLLLFTVPDNMEKH